ncbi:MAG: hypothetical protein RSA87_03920 [Malacoplasma sp.]
MNTLTENITKYIKAIELEIDEIEQLVNICEFIGNINTKDIIGNEELLSKLMYLLLKSFQKKAVINQLKLEVEEAILKAFENIHTINEKENIYVDFIKFLYSVHNDIDISERVFLMFDELCSILEDVKFIFDIKKDNQLYFKIGKLLDQVVSNDNFDIDNLSEPLICKIILSLQAFENGYEKSLNKITEMIQRYNLQLFKYLRLNKNDSWKKNLEKNGVITIVDLDDKTIYIRSNKKDYFGTDNGYECEYNAQNGEIAWFKKIYIDPSAILLSAHEVLEEEHRDKLSYLFSFVFEKKCFNILNDQSLYIENNSLSVINPYCFNDKYIIREDNNYTSDLQNALELIFKPYYLNQVIIKNNSLDSITIGFLCQLLMIFHVDIIYLFEAMKKLNTNIQNSVINHLLSIEGNEKLEKIARVLNLYEKEFSLVEKQDFDGIRLNDIIGIYPLIIDFVDGNLINLLSNGKYREEVELSKKTKHYSVLDQTWTDSESNVVECVCLDENKSKYDYEILYQSKIYIGHIIDNVGKLNDRIKTMNKILSTHVCLNNAYNNDYNKLFKLMKLHKASLLEVRNKTYENSMYSIRFYYHMLRFRINDEDKLNKFFCLIYLHDKVSYNEDSFKYFKNAFNNGVLNVPKDNAKCESNLKAIYYNILQDSSVRQYDLFVNTKLVERNGKVCMKFNEKITTINKVNILFDLVQTGKSSSDVVKAYLKNNPNNTKIQRYYLNEKEIGLYDILIKNNAELVIDIAYGSITGEEAIKDVIKKFLNNKSHDYIFSYKINVNHCLNMKATTSFVSDYKALYNIKEESFINNNNMFINEGNFPVIRQFNQPKRNMFIEKCLQADNIYSLFVIKKEIKIGKF